MYTNDVVDESAKILSQTDCIALVPLTLTYPQRIYVSLARVHLHYRKDLVTFIKLTKTV